MFGSTLDWLVQSLMFVICVATSGLRDVCFMFLFDGSMFPFLFRVLVTLISVYTFSICYFCGFVTFDLNIFLHLIKKKKEVEAILWGNWRGYQREPDRQMFRMKMDLPNFNGQLQIEGFLDWLVLVERFFDYMDILEDKKVKLVAYRLLGGASAWWE